LGPAATRGHRWLQRDLGATLRADPIHGDIVGPLPAKTVKHGRIGPRPANHRIQNAVEPGCAADPLLGWVPRRRRDVDRCAREGESLRSLLNAESAIEELPAAAFPAVVRTRS